MVDPSDATHKPLRIPGRVVLVWGRATGIGGTETRMLELTQELRLRGHSVESVFLYTEPSRLKRALAGAGADIINLSSLFALRIYLGNWSGPVICVGLRASLSVRLLGLGTGGKIYELRNGLEFGRSRFIWTLDRLTQSRVVKFITNSQAAAERLIDNGIQPGRVRVVRSALGPEWERWAPGARKRRTVVMVGNSRPEKNHTLGIRALAECDGEVDLTVYTDCDASIREELNLFRARPGKRAHVFMGRSMTPEMMAEHAILLHPSISESLPRVILEAQSQGLIVVATDTGDTASVISGRGTVVAPDDRRALTAALSAALDEPMPEECVSTRDIRTVSVYTDELLREVW